MGKTEFLQNLRERLNILNEREQEDILSEYEQHIELRMESGLTEEEAIQDFGDIEELVKEILEAYNVNPEYGRRKKGLFRKESREAGEKAAAGMGRKTGEKIKGLWAALCRGIASVWKKAFQAAKTIAGWCISPFLWIRNRRKEKSGAEKKEISGSCLAETKRGRTGILRGIWNFFLWCMLLFIKCMVICIISPVAIAELLALVGLGILIVLLFMGYPVLGLTIITVGCLICGAVLLWLVKEILVLKTGKREACKA